ncbi:zinc-ribbon domain-containing protein [Streptococcus anginosus]|uniref:zinc-ribbon domain-containing protein n=1 Tax=Streptococcus anginosus TaxID=1328 RepID=UPI00066DA61F
MKVCLRCQHVNDEENNFCIKCGAPLKNICTNKRCPNWENAVTLADEAVFCPLCGTETLFKVYGMVSSPLDFSEEELPF